MASYDIYIRLLARNLAYREIHRSTKALENMAAGTKLLGTAMKGLAAFGVISAIASIGKAAHEAAVSVAEFQAVSTSFNNMAVSMGVDADKILSDLQSLSHGAISELELMQIANEAFLTGNREFINNLPMVFSIARSAAISTGQDISTIFSDIVRGIAKASPRIIDNAHIYINMTEILEDYAKAQGKSIDMLDEATKQHVMLYSVLGQGAEQVAQVGQESVTTAEKLDTLGAAWKDFLATSKEGGGLAGWLGDIESGLAGILRRSADYQRAQQQINELADQYTQLYDEAAHKIGYSYKGAQDAMDALNLLFLENVRPGESPAVAKTRLIENGELLAILEEQIAKLQELMAKTEPVRPEEVGLFELSRAQIYSHMLEQEKRLVQEWDFSGDLAPFYKLVEQLDRAFTDLIGVLPDQTVLAKRGAALKELSRIYEDTSLGPSDKQLAILRFFKDLDAGIDKLKGKSPIVLSVYLQGMDDAKSKIDSLVLSLSDVLEIQDMIRLRGELTKGAGIIYSKYAGFEAEARLKQMLDNIDNYYDQIRKGAETTVSDVGSAFDQLASDIERVLMQGSTVSESDLLWTQVGLYQDKALEAARRLDDIAKLGAQSPWYESFVIPPEVLQRGEQAVRAWAMDMAADVRNLARPDLIDWDAFVRQWEKFQSDQAARELTIRTAMAKLQEAGLLTGDNVQARAQVEKMLGIDNPETQVAAFANKFQKAFVQHDPIGAMATSMSTSLAAHQQEYEAIGSNMATTIAGAFSTALTQNLGSIRYDVAELLAPEVAQILANNRGVLP